MTRILLEQDFVGTRLLSLVRPDLEHHCALDFCASRLAREEQPAVVLASNALLAHEILKRFAYREVAVVARGDWDEHVLQSSLLHRNTSATPFRVFKLGTLQLVSPHIIWTEPVNQDTVQTVLEVRKHLAPGGQLYVMTTGRLARFQTSTKSNPHSTVGAAGLTKTLKLLRQANFDITEIVGFHSTRSIFWGFAAQLAARFGRADLADRWIVRMRESFVLSGWVARFTTVNVIVATANGGADDR